MEKMNWFIVTLVIQLFSVVLSVETQLALSLFDTPWVIYKKQYGKSYTLLDDINHRVFWLANVNIINAHNALAAVGLSTYTMKQSYMTDHSPIQLKLLTGLVLSSKLKPVKSDSPIKVRATVPSSIDYRNSPCMPAIKSQGQCGSCWAFAATTPIEYQKCIKNKNNISLNLSEQQLVDCSFADGNTGCSGGDYASAWQYLKQYGQMNSISYPYESGSTKKNGPCRYNANSVKANVTGFISLTQYNEASLMQTVATNGPVAVAICANCISFINYGGGIYNDPFCTYLCIPDHAVTIVGYGTSDKGTPYWIGRNSWGVSWGISGYFLLQRGINQNQLASLPYSVIVK